MGLGCGEIAGGGMSGGIWVVRVFNTGDDGGGDGGGIAPGIHSRSRRITTTQGMDGGVGSF